MRTTACMRNLSTTTCMRTRLPSCCAAECCRCVPRSNLRRYRSNLRKSPCDLVAPPWPNRRGGDTEKNEGGSELGGRERRRCVLRRACATSHPHRLDSPRHSHRSAHSHGTHAQLVCRGTLALHARLTPPPRAGTRPHARALARAATRFAPRRTSRRKRSSATRKAKAKSDTRRAKLRWRPSWTRSS